MREEEFVWQSRDAGASPKEFQAGTCPPPPPVPKKLQALCGPTHDPRLAARRLLFFPAEAAGTFSPQNTIIALNKCDLKDAKPSEFQNLSSRFETVEVSCRKGFGIDALRESIIKLIEKFHIRASADDVLVGARHAAALERALVSVREARKKVASGAAGELVASDLREALNSLGEILGKTDNEDVLDRIFSKFCIGK